MPLLRSKKPPTDAQLMEALLKEAREASRNANARADTLEKAHKAMESKCHQLYVENQNLKFDVANKGALLRRLAPAAMPPDEACAQLTRERDDYKAALEKSIAERTQLQTQLERLHESYNRALHDSCADRSRFTAIAHAAAVINTLSAG
jgi:chromosome segregation ATPase